MNDSILLSNSQNVFNNVLSKITSCIYTWKECTTFEDTLLYKKICSMSCKEINAYAIDLYIVGTLST